ncbi:MAG TPA: circularly permuted type 2 ATP-grasp protein [Vicinamibacteria bacterium]|nr:circularly permuted type 2 ATP-grasp protein [Vicinamibacteria bacterium]
MDEQTARAVEDYNRLLRDEKAHFQELQTRLADRLRAAKLTFGGRLLCPFLRPNFVSPAAYEQIRGVCRHIVQAVEKVEAELGEALWDRVDLTPEERELVAIHPGYARSSPSARLDSFLTPDAYQFVELNAESPAGIAYSETLEEVFLELPLMQKFQEKWTLRRFEARQKLLDTLLSCHREAGGRQEHPTIAIVDYEDVPTRTEHHLFREFFSDSGYPSFVCDPRDLVYEKGSLRYQGRSIDIVYKRLLVNELIERKDRLQALISAARDRAVTVVNPFRCKPIHKKAIFAVLTDASLQALFSEAQRAAIAAHVPWTRRVLEREDTRDGKPVDLPRYIRDHREHLVLKPNDEYGGKGVFIGWEMTQTDWEAALAEALQASYVVQEKVELQRRSFPELDAQATEPQLRDVVVDLDPFVFQGEVEGFLTRLSGSSLANVTSGGGQVPGFVVEPR